MRGLALVCVGRQAAACGMISTRLPLPVLGSSKVSDYDVSTDAVMRAQTANSQMLGGLVMPNRDGGFSDT
jgi:hypothetical protein